MVRTNIRHVQYFCFNLLGRYRREGEKIEFCLHFDNNSIGLELDVFTNLYGLVNSKLIVVLEAFVSLMFFFAIQPLFSNLRKKSRNACEIYQRFTEIFAKSFCKYFFILLLKNLQNAKNRYQSFKRFLKDQ
jgi:hypothetical protein